MKDKIDALIASELERANGIHRSFFVSAHEGESVISEEIDEAYEDLACVIADYAKLWTAVRKRDVRGQTDSVKDLHNHAKMAIEELIQVCAMCDKFTKTIRGGRAMKPSKPFSNGSEYHWWTDQFCERCNKFKTDGFGSPLPGNCEIEQAIAESGFDLTKWPNDKIVSTSEYSRLCTEFENNDKDLMKSYKKLFEEEEQ